MLLPFDTPLSFWLSQSIYRWEPGPPAEEAATRQGDATIPGSPGGADTDGAPSCLTTGLPAMRLTFQGVKWTACPVFGMRENVAWEQMSQTRREVDEGQRDDKQREARKVRPPVPRATTD